MYESFKRIFEKNIAPRWIIFILDIAIIWSVYFIIILAFWQKESITDILYAHSLKLFLAGVIFITAYLIVKPHHNIIRHSTIQDFLIVIFVQCLCSLGLLILSLFNSFLIQHNQREVLFPEIIIHFFISGFILVFLRMIIRYVGSYLLQGTVKTRKTLVFGAGCLGLMARSVIERDDAYNYHIIGFIDDNPNFVGKRLEGIPVYSVSKTFKQIVKEQNINDIIIAVNDFEISKEKKVEFINLCLEKRIKVKEIQEISTWLNFPRRKANVQNINIDDLLGREPILIDIRKISNGLSGKTVMVTGAAGSIGSEIVRQITQFKPKKIILIDQAESELFKLQNEIKANFKNSVISIIVANITDSTRMRKIFATEYPDIVYHASAYKHVPLMEDHPYEAVKNNVGGTKILADLSVEFEVDRFVMISTDKAVNPTNVMGASKRICEIYVQSLSQLEDIKTQFITTRFGNVLGSNGSVVPVFKKQIERGGPVTITHKDITRFFMTIPEASQLVLEAGFMGSGGEIFLFDMGKPVRIYDLAEKMISLAGYEPNKDIKIVFTGLRPGEKLYEELLTSKENCKSTLNDKILIARGRSQIYEEVNNKISEMLLKLSDESDQMIVARMKDLVPEFFSQNSRFEELDYKINIFDFKP
ncbi:MAG: nucleoside-diphosphate sugar epimerase/dehydratase [Bacteroidota bacterium]|nr:nucleoside-diphosphate sugar epimerase/dehydratase [Bacteroidota bacterium]